jgi:hypothetical protein
MKNKYTHIERLTSAEVEGILDGTCYFYPKLDGANTSVELSSSGKIVARSRNTVLGCGIDLRGFNEYIQQRLPELEEFFKKYPDFIIFGEWLVPHTIKTYTKSAWNKFYVFDFYDKLTETYLNFEIFRTEVVSDFEMVPLLAKASKPTPELIDRVLNSNDYLLDSGQSEGVVIKNYEYTNVYGRHPFAKVINTRTSAKPLPPACLEQQIVDFYLTQEYVLKELNKLDESAIAKVIHVVYNEFVRDYMSEILKKYKNPTINFRDLKKHIAKTVVDTILV